MTDEVKPAGIEICLGQANGDFAMGMMHFVERLEAELDTARKEAAAWERAARRRSEAEMEARSLVRHELAGTRSVASRETAERIRLTQVVGELSVQLSAARARIAELEATQQYVYVVTVSGSRVEEQRVFRRLEDAQENYADRAGCYGAASISLASRAVE